MIFNDSPNFYKSFGKLLSTLYHNSLVKIKSGLIGQDLILFSKLIFANINVLEISEDKGCCGVEIVESRVGNLSRLCVLCSTGHPVVME